MTTPAQSSSSPTSQGEPPEGASAPPGDPPSRGQTWLVRGALVVLLVGGLYALSHLGGHGSDDAIDTLFPVPSFELTDQDGHPFGLDELRGRVWVASFLFTSCTQACPTLAAQLANLRARIAHHGDRAHVVSITVDPEVDTPERLREYAARFGDTAQWTLLTGAPDDVRRTTERAFFQPTPLRTELEVAPGYDVLHGTGVLLVDRDGVCRGLYTLDGPGLDRLVSHIDRLLE